MKIAGINTIFFLHSSAYQNGSSTRLAVNMTPGHVTDHVTLESSVSIMLIHTRRQMTLFSREGNVREGNNGG